MRKPVNINSLLRQSVLSLLVVCLLICGIGDGSSGTTIWLEDVDSGQPSPAGNYRWRDVADQLYAESYRTSYNYTQAAVSVTYDASGSTMVGTLNATNLKPNFAYQLKLQGIPNTGANERIGLVGRWWQEEWDGSSWTNGKNLNDKGDGSSPNPNDILYFERKDIPDPSSPTGLKYKYTGYLVFDYFCTDEYGNATLDFETHSSYHVLWKTTQRGQTGSDGPLKTTTFDVDPSLSPAYDEDYAEQTVEIFGEWERLPVGGVLFEPGEYFFAQIFITEESFHGSGGAYAGGWAAAMGSDIGSDMDNDEVFDVDDNCPRTYNPDQANSDSDGFGDACDLCSLWITHPESAIQNVPFSVTVIPFDGQGDTCFHCEAWIDFSSSDPCVKLPQGDLHLWGPRNFTVIAPCISDGLIVEVEEVKQWDPDRIIFTYTNTIVVLPAEIDQPDSLTVSDLPNDHGGFVQAEWDYSDNHPGLAQYNTVDYYMIYRTIYPIVCYDDPGHPLGKEYAYPHLIQGESFNGWGTTPEKTVAMHGGYIGFRYTGLDPSGAMKNYRARILLFQAADPAVETRVVKVKVGGTDLTAHGLGSPEITVTNIPTTYVFEIPDAEITAQGRLYLYVIRVAGSNAVVSEVWIEEDDPQWYNYGIVWTSPVTDSVGGERIILSDYGFPGTTSDYYVQAVDADLFQGKTGPGEFVVSVCEMIGGIDESNLCGPIFGRSLDNVAPADPADIRVAENKLRWLRSDDDRLLQTGRDWWGNEWKIYGVTNYVIFRNGVYIGMVSRGVSSWMDVDGIAGKYRVLAYDGENLSEGKASVKVVPTTCRLLDNYPNPFNPETRIAYTLPEAMKVSIGVYNTLGQEVEVLIDGEQDAGYHVVLWDARDEASGVYFYRIVAKDYMSTKRMVVLK